MGFLDKIKKSPALDKVADAIADNATKVDDGIDKAAALVDEKTGRKHSQKIDKVAGAAKKGVDQAEAQAKKAKKAKQAKQAEQPRQTSAGG